MTPHSAFNGQVQFDCTGANLKTLIVRDGLTRAIPDAASFVPGSPPFVLFENLIEFLGKTRSISFIDIGLTADVEALQTFWEFTLKSIDYRVIWNEFILLPVEVNNEWSEAIAGVIDPRLLAPAEVQPGASDDTQLEATGTEDAAKKKKSGKPT